MQMVKRLVSLITSLIMQPDHAAVWATHLGRLVVEVVVGALGLHAHPIHAEHLQGGGFWQGTVQGAEIVLLWVSMAVTAAPTWHMRKQ